jgi:6-pyruvoyltetrahydropterin/6-carboxytetrahydropterin synthase
VLIRKLFRFESSHVLPHHAGKCARLHGHSYRLEVTVRGPLRESGSASGMVMDFRELDAIVRSEAIDRLDHRHLNDIIENPTCERILLWIAVALGQRLPGLDELVLWETATSCAVLRGDDLGAAIASHG